MFDWGAIPELNPNAVLVHHPNPPPTRDRTARRKKDNPITLNIERFDPKSIGGKRLTKIKIDPDDWLSRKPHCLGGRATAVLGSSHATEGDLACKISFPEIARENEGKMIEEIRQEIEEDVEWKHLSKHLPEVLMYGDMSRYGTQRIRSMLGMSIEGRRILRLLVLKRLARLTSVAGEVFVKAWVEAVRCKWIYDFLLLTLSVLFLCSVDSSY